MNHTPDEPISAEPSDGLVDGVAPDASEPTAEPIAKPANWKRWGPWGLGLGLVAGAVVLVFGGVADFSRASDHQRAEDLLIDEAAQLSAQYRDLDSTATAAERERVGLEEERRGVDEATTSLRQGQATTGRETRNLGRTQSEVESVTAAVIGKAEVVDNAVEDLRQRLNGFVSSGNAVRVLYEDAVSEANRRDEDGMRETLSGDGTRSLGEFTDSAGEVLGALFDARILLDGFGLLQGERTLWSDDFDNEGSGWSVTSSEAGSTGYADGQYAVSVGEAGDFSVGVSPHQFSDLSVDVDVTAQAGSLRGYRYGVMCRAIEDGGIAGDLFVFGPLGHFGIGTVNALGESVALEEGVAAGISRPTGEVNHLSATCNGPVLSLSVNGEVLAEVVDTTFATGHVGLAILAESTITADAHFDEFVMSVPDPPLDGE